MLKNFCAYIIFLILLPASLLAQQAIQIGNTELKSKSLEVGKGSCMITPNVIYDTNHPYTISITLSATWFDKDGMKTSQPEDQEIYLVDKFSPWLDHIKENNQYAVTGFTQKKENDLVSSINQLKKNGESLGFPDFPLGYVPVISSTSPFLFTLDALDKSEYTLTLFFAHVSRKNSREKKLEEVGMRLQWGFMLPPPVVYRQECIAKQDHYERLIKSLRSDFEALDFQTNWGKPDASSDDLKRILLTYTEQIESARSLKNEVEEDIILMNCPAVMHAVAGLLEDSFPLRTDLEELEQELLERFPPEEEEQEIVKKEPEVIEKTPVREKEKVRDRSKEARDEKRQVELEFAKKKYSNTYSQLEEQFFPLEDEIQQDITKARTAIKNNGDRIASIEMMFNIQDKPIPDSLQKINQELEICEAENRNNNQRVNEALQAIRSFHSKVDQQLSFCKAEFEKIDKKAVSQEGVVLMERFNVLLREVQELETALDDLKGLVVKQNKSITALIAKRDGDEELLNAITSFETQFGDMLQELESLLSSFEKQDLKFENKKFSRWYFKWVRKKLLSRTDALNQQYVLLRNDFDSLKSDKEVAFSRFAINPLMESQGGIEKGIAGFDVKLETLRSKISDSDYERFPYGYAVLAFILLTILVFGISIYVMALRKRQIKLAGIPVKTSDTPPKNVIKLQQSQTQLDEKGKGLYDYLDKTRDLFLELDLSKEWKDSSVRKVFFSRECIIKTYRFFEDSIHAVEGESTANETGGYLVGQWDFNKDDPGKYDVSLEDFIEPGDDATFSKYQLNFGAKIGVKLQSVLDNLRQKTGRDVVMTAWFHSHPGLKIFLSDYDLTVQKDFAGKVHPGRMLALVLDPYTPDWDVGIFAHKSSGEMNNAVDSLKFFSFDSMYKWALKPQYTEEQDQKPEVPQNHFHVNISQVKPDHPVRHFFLSNQAILELKRFVEDAKLALQSELSYAVLSGIRRKGGTGTTSIIVNNLYQQYPNLIQVPEGEDETVGAVFCKPAENVMTNHEFKSRIEGVNSWVSGSGLWLIYFLEEDILEIHTGGYAKSDAETSRREMARITLDELIEWTRRRK